MSELSGEGDRDRRRRLAAVMASRISSGLHLGLLRHGDKLSSIRALAREFSIDPRAALAAYRLLEEKGIVEMRPRSGIYVAGSSTSDGVAAARSLWLMNVLAEGLGFGIAPIELSETLRRSVGRLRLRAVVMECNDDQLFSVSDELKRDYGFEVTTVDLTDNTSAVPNSALGADCVVTTVPHAQQAEELARVLGVPAIVVSMCDDLFDEVRRLLPSSPVYFIVADVRFGLKLSGIFAADDGVANLRVLVNGHDSLAEIPDGAPVYLTRLARKSIDHFPQLDRVIPEARVFSPVSARDLLSFVLSANQSVGPGRGSAAASVH